MSSSLEASGGRRGPLVFSKGSFYPPCPQDMKQSGGEDQRLELRTLRVFCHCSAVCLWASGLPSLGSIVNGERGTRCLASVSFPLPREGQPIPGMWAATERLTSSASMHALRKACLNLGNCKWRLRREHPAQRGCATVPEDLEEEDEGWARPGWRPLSPTSRQAECYLLDGAGSWHWAQVIY